MKVLVIGAGPAGLCAAAEASAAGAETLLIDRNEKVGKKLYITGKGRCNVTNAVPPSEFLNHVAVNSKFLYGAIFAFTPSDTTSLLAEYGVETKVERGNRVFPASDKASDVTKALTEFARKKGVKIRLNSFCSSLTAKQNGFDAVIGGSKERFDKVILACGGKSYPSTGSDGNGYVLAQKLGHEIVPPVPALVGIRLRDDVSEASGLSLKNVRATIESHSEFGEMLFTERGVSGPIILTLSSLINRMDLREKKLAIDLKPALSAETLDKRILSEFSVAPNKEIKNVMPALLPKTLIPFVLSKARILPEKPVNSVTRSEREALIFALKNLCFEIEGLCGLEEAVVTSGGVSVKEINPKTMESKLVKGLYFAGEIIDYDAFTGGFNIQAALSTGIAAGRSAGCGD